MLAKNILRGKSSPRVSGRPERNSIPNKVLICGASLMPALALLCALVADAHGQSYQGGLRGSLHDNAINALSNVTPSLTNEATRLTRTTAPSNSSALTNKTEVCRTPQ
jgi:hypothetical protein